MGPKSPVTLPETNSKFAPENRPKPKRKRKLAVRVPGISRGPNNSTDFGVLLHPSETHLFSAIHRGPGWNSIYNDPYGRFKGTYRISSWKPLGPLEESHKLHPKKKRSHDWLKKKPRSSRYGANFCLVVGVGFSGEKFSADILHTDPEDPRYPLIFNRIPMIDSTGCSRYPHDTVDG